MKPIHLVLALAAVAGCGKQNDVANLQEEAVTLTKYYSKKVDALAKRIDESYSRAQATVKADQSLVRSAYMRAEEARDEIAKLRVTIAPGPDGKSKVEKDAEAAAKQGNAAELRKIVDNTQEEIDRSLTIITSDIETFEGWLSYYDNKLLVLGAPNTGAQPAGEQPAPSGSEPATPGEQTTPAAGQPAAQGSAAPQQGSASPAQPKAQAGSAAPQPKK